MKFLLHSSNTTFDELKKRYYFKWSKRETNQGRLRIRNFCFTSHTGLSPKPHVVFVRSNKLSEMIQNKHSLVLNEHTDEQDSNIICVLFETLEGRYEQKTFLDFRLNPHSISEIDIYFTAGNQTLSNSADLPAAVTDEQILAISGLRMFFDHTVNMDTSYTIQNTVGSTVRYLANRIAGENYLFQGYQNFEIAAISNNMKGVVSDENWNYQVDSTMPNIINSNEVTLQFVMKTSTATLTTEERIFDFWAVGVRTSPSGQLTLKSGTLGNIVYDPVTNISLLPSTDYLFKITRHDTDGDGVYVHTVKVIKLADNTVQTGTSAGTQIDMTVSGQTSLYISSAQQHFLSKTGVLGPFFYFESINSTDADLIENYVKQHYSEQTPTSLSGEEQNFYGEFITS